MEEVVFDVPLLPEKWTPRVEKVERSGARFAWENPVELELAVVEHEADERVVEEVEAEEEVVVEAVVEELLEVLLDAEVEVDVDVELEVGFVVVLELVVVDEGVVEVVLGVVDDDALLEDVWDELELLVEPGVLSA